MSATPIGFMCKWQTASRTYTMPVPQNTIDEAWDEVIQLLNSEGNLIVWELESGDETPNIICAIAKDAIDAFTLQPVTEGASLCQDPTHH